MPYTDTHPLFKILFDDDDTFFAEFISYFSEYNDFNEISFIRETLSAKGRLTEAILEVLDSLEHSNNELLTHLNTQGITLSDIISVLKWPSSGRHNFRALQELFRLNSNSKTDFDTLSPVFNLNDIIKILSHHGGSNNLAALQGLLVKDANGITPLAQLMKAGFTPVQLIAVLSHGGGSKNLAALQGLLVKDANGITPLAQLIKASFTSVQLIAVLSHGGGSKNLASLQGLLVKDANDITPLAQLIKASFTREQLIAVLSNIGGSKNLAALQGLLVKDANGITPLAQLREAHFTPEQLIAVLNNIGGSKNLAALQGLLVKDANDITPLVQLIKASFTPEQLIALLSHGGGSKNLAALQGLLVKDANDITPLTQLIKAHFTPEQLIAVLNNIGGSKNLTVLQGLLVKDANDITPLAQLIKAGFTPVQLIAVLSHDGGSKNLAALQGLLVKDANDITPLVQLIKASFTPEQLIAVLSHNGGSKNIASLKEVAQCNLQPEWISFIYPLANKSARSARLNLLAALLKIEGIHELCVNNSVLIDDFCFILSKKTAKEFKAITIKTPNEFTDFVQENSSLTRKIKRSAVVRSQPLHKRQRPLSTNPTKTVPQLTSTTASFSSLMDIDDIIPLTPLASSTATSCNTGELSFLEQPLEVTEFAKLLDGLDNEPSLLDNTVSSSPLAHKRPRSSALSATVPNPKKRRVFSSASLDYLHQELTALIHSGKSQSNIDSLKVGSIPIKKKTEIGIALKKVRKKDSYLLMIINKEHAQQWCNAYCPLTLSVESHGEEPLVNPCPIEVIEKILSSQELSSPVILPATTSVIKHRSAQNPHSFFSTVQEPRATSQSPINNPVPFIPNADLELGRGRPSNYTSLFKRNPTSSCQDEDKLALSRK